MPISLSCTSTSHSSYNTAFFELTTHLFLLACHDYSGTINKQTLLKARILVCAFSRNSDRASPILAEIGQELTVWVGGWERAHLGAHITRYG
jgi:hypothetical protein